MADLQRPLTLAALLAGSGVATYFGSRWLMRNCFEGEESKSDVPPAPAGAAGTGNRRDSSGLAPFAGPAGCLTAGPAAPAVPMRPLMSTVPASGPFDEIFDAYRGEIPLAYMRALSTKESGMRPDARSGSAWGLMQIVEVVRRDYNRAHQSSYRRTDLLDPSVNTAIAAWLLRTIIKSYARRHPDVPNLQADWDNLRFVELLTFGWNAGWSEAGGVGRVARYLEGRGEFDITIELVYQNARAAGASSHLSRPEKVRWCKSVARLYERERRAGVAGS